MLELKLSAETESLFLTIEKDFLPNAETRQALNEGYRGQFDGKAKTIKELFAALNEGN